MRILGRTAVAVMCLVPLAAPCAAPAPAATDMKGVLDAADARRIDADLRFLADDALEGRGTGQQGGRLAALYLDTRFRLLGLEPAAPKGGYLQEVPLVGIDTQPRSRLAITGGPRPLEAPWPGAFVATAGAQKK